MIDINRNWINQLTKKALRIQYANELLLRLDVTEMIDSFEKRFFYFPRGAHEDRRPFRVRNDILGVHINIYNKSRVLLFFFYTADTRPRDRDRIWAIIYHSVVIATIDLT